MLNPALLALTAALMIASLGAGAVPLSPATVIAALFGGADDVARAIVLELRLPRALLAAAIGAGLGASGAALQGLLRNPLAEPAVFGAPQSAALAASCVIAFRLADPLSPLAPLAAIAGALVSVGAVVAIAGRRGDVATLLLAGLAIGSFAGAATALALNLAPDVYAVLEIVFWLMGSLEDRTWGHLALAGPFIALGLAILLPLGRGLRALTLGEETAAGLGVRLGRLRAAVVAGTAVAVGGGVAVAGAIGFVGLVAPHLVRPFVGYDPGRTLVPAALAGAGLVVAADMLARLTPGTGELRLGVVTALVGLPVFLAIVLRGRGLAAEAGA